ncbi:MAG: AraC family transcriptional regulator [Epsilonproteobacteria bacterium]|nr:AraC family transcriptional regulator [Campylobacterota bacterium]
MSIKYNSLDISTPFHFIKISENHQKEFFKAHRHDFYEIIYITEGVGKHSIDFQAYELQKDTMSLIKPAQIHEWLLEEFNNQYDGYIFLFSKEFFPNHQIIDDLFHIDTMPLITINDPIKTYINNLILMLEDKQSTDTYITLNIFSTLLSYIIKLQKTSTNTKIQDIRIIKLLTLIETHFIKEKSATFYAKRLDLTTKRVNELTKKYLDKTLSSLIIERNIVEIKRELTYNDQSIKEISENLGFNDTSYFSKFFKKYTTYSPLEFKHLKNRS